MKIRPARSDETDSLSALAVASKATWGYDEAFMERCRVELVVRDEHVERGLVNVAVDEFDTAMGFYALKEPGERDAELGLLFVAPAHLRRGAGRYCSPTRVAKRAVGAGRSCSSSQIPSRRRSTSEKARCRRARRRPRRNASFHSLRSACSWPTSLASDSRPVNPSSGRRRRRG